MPKTDKLIFSLNGGELTPLLDARVDQAKYEAGCRDLQNMIPLVHGGATRRPGTEYITGAISSVAANKSRLVAFQFSVDTKYVLEFGNQVMRVFKGGSGGGPVYTNGSVYELTTPYLTADLFDLKFEHSNDVMFITHSSYEPRILARTGDASWTLTVTTRKKGPFLDENTDQGITITPSTTADPFDAEDSYVVNDDFHAFSYGAIWLCQTFTASDDYTANTVRLKMWREGNPGTISVSIRATTAGKPSGADLAVGTTSGNTLPSSPTGEWRNISLGAGTALTNGTVYAIVLRVTGGDVSNRVDWRIDVTSPSYAGGSYGGSSDSGSNWTMNTNYDFMFQVSSAGGTALTLTASAPIFDDDHAPAGSDLTSTSTTGAIFRLNQLSEEREAFATFFGNGSGTAIQAYLGDTIDFITGGTWTATIVLERSYDGGTTYETVWTTSSDVSGISNDRVEWVEENADALYRATMSSFSEGGAYVRVKARSRLVDRYVQITAVASSTSATAIILDYGMVSYAGLVNTNPTYRWSEGAWSEYRGWPKTVTISNEDRLMFGGSTSQPLTVWGSRVGNYTCFLEGDTDDAAITWTLTGQGQQNKIHWMLQKQALILGTAGGEHRLGASNPDEPMTPTNVRAKVQTNYGSEDIQAMQINDAVLFVQRGGRKVREMLYSLASDAYEAKDVTVFSEHITETGIVDWAYQKSPDPILWCVLDNGEIAIMSYDRNQNVYSWASFVTETLADV